MLRESSNSNAKAVPGWPEVDAPRPHIAVVGPNPAMDRTEEIEHFRPHEVNRALVSSPRAGGKSFIVARALRRLNRPVTLYGFLGGATGQYLRAESVRLGIRDRQTPIKGETRINTVLVDRHTGRATVVNEPGPMVTEQEADQLLAALNADLTAGDILILTGSLPRGVDRGLYAKLVQLARQRGALSIVDAEGDVLAYTVAALPWVVKCNLIEFRSIAADAPHRMATGNDYQRLLRAMRDVVNTGVGLVIVTLGSDGVMAASATEAMHVAAAPVDTKNPTGSGDTFLAAFAAACADGAPLEEALRLGTAAASLNAAVLVPDIGPDPALGSIVERVAATRLEPVQEPARSGSKP